MGDITKLIPSRHIGGKIFRFCLFHSHQQIPIIVHIGTTSELLHPGADFINVRIR